MPPRLKSGALGLSPLGSPEEGTLMAGGCENTKLVGLGALGEVNLGCWVRLAAPPPVAVTPPPAPPLGNRPNPEKEEVTGMETACSGRGIPGPMLDMAELAVDVRRSP